jgi:hypothetical protein
VNEFTDLVALAKDENKRKTELFNLTHAKLEQFEINL